ncbi:hypothetical protein EHE19_004195 [Ruminiclostridium herbifermentans]|uniref:Cohesin domain-containing protein n=1 Tax=Ruminiclostridium herbifermentans TaxID=2488810 RepID=A0A7H1VQL8_9FIRM|nr:cohesin domain-containing protein [Ruminiclostridium herbifermentans]QNU67680.1 hypothetical protein EHE19_004195 [Ruminiclostridium herbifermentans]
MGNLKRKFVTLCSTIFVLMFVLSTVSVSAVQGNTWTTMAAMATARSTNEVIAANGKIYAIGGYNGGYLNSIEEYDTVTDEWTSRASMTNTRRYFTVVLFNEKIYAIGGFDSKNYLSSLEEYTPEYPAPENLTAISGHGKVNLSWAASEGALSYNIKRSSEAGGPYTTIATGSAITYTDTTAVNGNTYYYVVSAVSYSNVESANSNEVSVTLPNIEETLEVVSVDKAKVGDEITADIVIHNSTNICAEDIKIAFDTSKLEFISAEGADGIKIYKEDNLTGGIRRYITASLGKANAANGDKILLKLTFKAKASGEAKIDIINGRIANNANLEKDIEEENCGEKTILIERNAYDVNRSGEFTLLDLGIAAWYFGDAAEDTDTSKYDADIVENGSIDDDDLTEIVRQILNNSNYAVI